MIHFLRTINTNTTPTRFLHKGAYFQAPTLFFLGIWVLAGISHPRVHIFILAVHANVLKVWGVNESWNIKLQHTPPAVVSLLVRGWSSKCKHARRLKAWQKSEEDFSLSENCAEMKPVKEEVVKEAADKCDLLWTSKPFVFTNKLVAHRSLFHETETKPKHGKQQR